MHAAVTAMRSDLRVASSERRAVSENAFRILRCGLAETCQQQRGLGRYPRITAGQGDFLITLARSACSQRQRAVHSGGVASAVILGSRCRRHAAAKPTDDRDLRGRWRVSRPAGRETIRTSPWDPASAARDSPATSGRDTHSPPRPRTGRIRWEASRSSVPSGVLQTTTDTLGNTLDVAVGELRAGRRIDADQCAAFDRRSIAGGDARQIGAESIHRRFVGIKLRDAPMSSKRCGNNNRAPILVSTRCGVDCMVVARHRPTANRRPCVSGGVKVPRSNFAFWCAIIPTKPWVTIRCEIARAGPRRHGDIQLLCKATIAPMTYKQGPLAHPSPDFR